MRFFLIIAFIISFQLSYAQNLKPMREPFTLKLPVDGKQFYEDEIKSTPYFPRPTLLQIYPNEKLNIEVEIKADTIFLMQVVKENLHPEKTIEIEFTQMVKDNKSEMMMLKVKNPFDAKLSYKARMYVIGNDKWIGTSIIPVIPKLIGYETWNEVIISLALYNWKLIK